MSQDIVKIPGRILYLSEDPELLRHQLRGADLTLEEAGRLACPGAEEIVPPWAAYFFEKRLGDFTYVGLHCRGQWPVAEDTIKRGGFAVSVSGARRGHGTVREAGPWAEKAAGIRVVLAESFEPVYLRACRMLGLLASTDLSLAAAIREGQGIPIEHFLQDLDALGEAIVRHGGLFEYTHRRLAGTPAPLPETRGPRPMTLAEKILARHAQSTIDGPVGVPSVQTGDAFFARTDWRFSHDFSTSMAAAFHVDMFGENAKVRNASNVLVFRDHLVALGRSPSEARGQQGTLAVSLQLKASQEAFCARHQVRLHGETPDGSAEGICHTLILERYALPGQLIVGTDSHTPHAGALGCLALGISSVELAVAWITDDVPVSIPPISRILLHGCLRPGVTAKDLALFLHAHPAIREGALVGHIVEFQGEAIRHLSVDERSTLTGTASDFGALSALVAPDEETLRFLQERRRIKITLAPWMCADDDAHYASTLDVDCDTIPCMLATPGHPGNGIPVAGLERDTPIDIAYVGTCSGGKREDLAQAHEVIRWALDKRIKLPLSVEFFIQFGSDDVRRHAKDRGWISVFEEAGLKILGPGCGACINAGPGVSTRKTQTVVSTMHRNHTGRSGPGPVWLASPATVAASAFAGKLCDFETLKKERG